MSSLPILYKFWVKFKLEYPQISDTTGKVNENYLMMKFSNTKMKLRVIKSSVNYELHIGRLYVSSEEKFFSKNFGVH